MIKTVYKPKGSRMWRLKYRFKPEGGTINDISLKTPDKQIAHKRATEILRKLEFQREGLLPPQSITDASSLLLEKHLDDFTKDLRRQGKAIKYIDNLAYRIVELSKSCQWRYPVDVNSRDFLNWRNRQSLSPKTLNDYLEAIRRFFNWMVRLERVSTNPLSKIDKVKRNGNKTRERRALSHDEARRLLQVDSPYRLVYLTALYTGLRRGELEQLEWRDVVLKEGRSFLRVRASTTKNGKEANIPLHPDLEAAIKSEMEKDVSPTQTVFARIPRVTRFKTDLKTAGIEFKDQQGRVLDFHSLRKTFGTSLAASNASNRARMDAMRLSDGRLLDFVYSDTTKLGTEEIITSLPSYTSQLSQIASQKLVPTGQTLSQGGTMAHSTTHSQSMVLHQRLGIEAEKPIPNP